jgi:hypothetical protein
VECDVRDGRCEVRVSRGVDLGLGFLFFFFIFFNIFFVFFIFYVF